ncbi:MAG: Mov34/MPN/PAD-1 family protein [Candidatus Hodarchaeales archaeon]|jgi:26S proteasome regulatory subunit N11
MDEHAISAEPKECIGLLAGFEDTTFPDRIFISQYVAITTGKAEEVEFSELHYKAFELMEMNDELGEYVVGWVHSHPGYGIFLSPTDLHTHYYSFQARNPKAVALVLEPTLRTLIHTQLNTKDPLSDFGIFQVELPEKGSKYFKARELKMGIVASFKYIEDKKKELEEAEKSGEKGKRKLFGRRKRD